MSYKEALIALFTKGWAKPLEHTSVSGNGFEIFFYGLKVICFYFIAYSFRILALLVFPLSALLVMYAENKYQKRRKEFEESIWNDL